MTSYLGGPPVESRAYNSTWLRSMASCGGTDDENLHGSTSRREDGVHFVGDWVAQSLWHARNVGRGCPPTEVDAAVLLSMVDLSYLSSCPYYSELGPEVCGDLFDMQFTHRVLWHLQNDSGCTGPQYDKTKEALEQHGAWSPVPPP
ncbi:hypothetical protein L6R50_12070 [Myxococcota bacterium]|nr:hypothetical protein [Myxococcota bacterium]